MWNALGMRSQDQRDGTYRPGGPGRGGSDREWSHFWPRSILGITALVLAASVGAALSGTILFAYYQYELTSITNRVNTYVADVNQRYRAAQPAVARRATTTDPGTVLRRAGPALWYLTTVNANGQPSVGTAFAVASSSSQTLLVGSYTTVAAATSQPGPAVYASRNGSQGVPVHLQAWEASQDLALLVLPEGGQPTLTLDQSPPSAGSPVFALSAGGAQGGVIAGQVTAASDQAVQDTAVLRSDDFQGGPLVDGSGQVVGVASRNYAPSGVSSSGVPVPVLCQRVLQCPVGTSPPTG